MHPICTGFQQLLVIKKSFNINNNYKNTPFLNLKFWRRGALAPFPQWDRGGSPSDATYSALASIRPLTGLDPLAVFE